MTNVKIIKRFPDITRAGFSFTKWNKQFCENNVILNGHYSSIEYPLHWTALSIKCAFGGTEQYETSRVKYNVNDKNFLVLNEGAMYSSRINNDSKVESFTINFKPDFAGEVIKTITSGNSELLDYPAKDAQSKYRFFERLYSHDEKSLSLLANIKMYINSPGESSSNRINELLGELLENMCLLNNASLNSASEISSEKRSTRLEIYKRLTFARDYMYSNYSENINNDMLAGIACLSPYHFLRLFKQVYKLTPHQYLTKIRLEAAKDLLQAGNDTVSGICQAVGFESTSSFCQLFRKYSGLSPENYRLKKAILKHA